MSNFHIRPASPVDAKFLVEAIEHADRGHLTQGVLDITIGSSSKDLQKFLQTLVLSDHKSEFHWSSFFVAEAGGEIAAAVSAARPVDMQAEAQIAMDEAYRSIGWREKDIKAMFERVAIIAAAMPRINPKTWVVKYAYTFPEFRLKGVMRELIMAALQVGLDKKVFRAETLLILGNTAILDFFQSLDFLVLEERYDRNLKNETGIPGFYKLFRKL